MNVLDYLFLLDRYNGLQESIKGEGNNDEKKNVEEKQINTIET